MPSSTNKWDSAELGPINSCKVFRGPPTEDEKKQINLILKASVNEIKALRYPTDDVVGEWRVLRFIRNLEGNTDKAKKNFKKYLQHRIEHNHLIEELGHEVRGLSKDDFIKWNECSALTPYLPVLPCVGESKDGSVIYYYAWQGGVNFDKLMNGRDKDDPIMNEMWIVIQQHEWAFWYLNEQSKKLNKMCYMRKIADFQGLSVNPFAYSGMKEMKEWGSALMGNDYCDGDDLYIIFNTPWIFNIIWPIMKLFLTKRQNGKIVMTDEKGLPDYMRSSCVPQCLGGKSYTAVDDLYKPIDEAAAASMLRRRKKHRANWKGRCPQNIEDLKIYCK